MSQTPTSCAHGPGPGGSALGQWRPPPPAFAHGAGVVFAYMTPWVLESPWQLRPDGPPALTSPQYAADLNWSKTTGSASSLTRTADQTVFAKFWNADTVIYFWDRVAVSLIAGHHSTMLENARLLAQLDLAMADAIICDLGCEVHSRLLAPRYGHSIGWNRRQPDDYPRPAWTPLLVTPAHPEFPSAHSTVSSAAATVLASFFGEHTRFPVDSNAYPGVTRSFGSFSAALEEIVDARVFAGIHFRTSCEVGQALRKKAGTYVLRHSCQPFHHHRLASSSLKVAGSKPLRPTGRRNPTPKNPDAEQRREFGSGTGAPGGAW